MVDTTSSISIKDASGVAIKSLTLLDPTGFMVPQSAPRVNGAPVSSINPMPVVIGTSTTVLDYSANSTTTALSGYVLVATVPVTPTRANVEVNNLSGAPIQLLLDDGFATTGTVTSLILSGGLGAPSQGGSWNDAYFKGRVRIYAPSSSAIVSARQS